MSDVNIGGVKPPSLVTLGIPDILYVPSVSHECPQGVWPSWERRSQKATSTGEHAGVCSVRVPWDVLLIFTSNELLFHQLTRRK